MNYKHAIIINLLNTPSVGRNRVRVLLSSIGSMENPFEIDSKILCKIDGIDIKTATAIKKYRHLTYGEKQVKRLEEKNIKLVSYWDDNYPVLLKKIYDPPVLLYTIGKALNKKEDMVSIVGTRTMTQYGRTMTKMIVKKLVEAGVSTTSGLARGIDTMTHRETVNLGGRTIAVLGSGIDVIYPSENKQLYQDILENGTIISEFPLGEKPDRKNFPQRNRIISGLSHGTIVVEAGDRSGSILTAFNAIDQNRDVFAVPGRVTDAMSVGSNRLIRNGAFPIHKGDEILDIINDRLFRPIKGIQKTLPLNLSEDEQSIFKHLGHDPIQIDDLRKKVGLDIAQLLQILLNLEMKNAVTQLSGKQFVIS
ncbi:MAG: DNA-protecting protein DprA [Candidatus Marinimicrobia bacterium]|nr:DNA-protecting protein DprA [Candidatus Neomarinimicrobiota bacterium]